MGLRERMQGALREISSPPGSDPLKVFEQGLRRARRRRRVGTVTVGAVLVAAAVVAFGPDQPVGGPRAFEVTGTPDTGSPDAAAAWRQRGHATGKLPGSAAALAVTDPAELRAVWQEHRFEVPQPEVDFDHAVVLLLGQADDPCPDELIRLEVEPAEGDTGVLRTEWRGPGCILSMANFVYAVEVHRGLLPRSLTVEGDQELSPSHIDLPPYDGSTPPAPSGGPDHLDVVFADQPVRPCVASANGGVERDLSDWQDARPPTRTKEEATSDLNERRPELDQQMRIIGTELSDEVVEIVLLDPSREALKAIARVTDPQRVCITPM